LPGKNRASMERIDMVEQTDENLKPIGLGTVATSRLPNGDWLFRYHSRAA